MSRKEPASPVMPRDARLPFLDGLRGLAALYVVLHHAALAVPPAGLGGLSLAVRFLLRHGHFAVAVFIVLSGYCLMRPVVLDPAGALRGGFLAYLGRRARRIVPPYYAALGLCWLLIAFIPALGHPPRTWWDRALPAFGRDNVASHLLLVHNLSDRWLAKIDPPAWSVATEWQIYLLFPALLVLWRRWGIAAAVGGGFAVGYGVASLAVPFGNPALRHGCPWYVGLFTLGMAAAVASSEQKPTAGRRASLNAMAIMLGLVAVLLVGLALRERDDRNFLVGDPLVGVVTALLIVRCARLSTMDGSRRVRCADRSAQRSPRDQLRQDGPDHPSPLAGEGGRASGRVRGRTARSVAHPSPGRGAADLSRKGRGEGHRADAESSPRNTGRSPLLRLLEARWLVGLGAFSYSLYLTHYPLLAWADAILRLWGCGSDVRLALLLLVASPVCLLAAYLFHLAFERPFLIHSGQRGQRNESSFVQSQPAPHVWTVGEPASSVKE